MGKDKCNYAVYAGTFDPVTNGHIDIACRAGQVFDRLFMAIAGGSPKASTKDTFFSKEERVSMMERAIVDNISADLASKIEVQSFSGMLVDYVNSVGARVIVRGLRAVSDYEYETQLAHTNRMLAPHIETIFFVTSEKTSFISSSVVRNVALNGGDISGMVPSVVVQEFKSKLLRLV